MDTTSDEKDGKVVEKDDSSIESRKEVNNSMPGFDLISENEKKVSFRFYIFTNLSFKSNTIK